MIGAAQRKDHAGVLPARARAHTSRDGLRVASVAIDRAYLPPPVADLADALVPRHADQCLVPLPDDPVFASTPYEAEVVAAELASDDGYLRPGWGLPPRPTVLDVGAHIGMFTLDVAARYPGARIVAVEPFGPSYAALAGNIRLHGHGDTVEGVNAAVSDRPGTAEISGCRGGALLASTTGDAGGVLLRTRETLRGSLPRLLARGSWPGDVAAWAAETAVHRLFAPQRHRVPRYTVTELMARHRLRRVSLLKVDVEGDETRVLDGISPRAWDAIDAVVLETGRANLAAVTDRLVRQGFQPVASASTMTTRSFGRDSVIVRARRGAPETAPPLRPRAQGRLGAAVRVLAGLRRIGLGLGAQLQPPGRVLVDACLGDPETAPGPLFLPWSSTTPAHRMLAEGESWARYLLGRYGSRGGDQNGDALTRVFGGDWATLPGRSAAAAVAARLAADQLMFRLVAASLRPALVGGGRGA